MKKEIFFYFARLGGLGFGGPLSLIAQMQIDLIEDKKWLDRDEFLTALPIIKAMPGPVAFQTAVFIGFRKEGFWGGLLAAIGLVAPAFFLMVTFAHFAQSMPKEGFVQDFLYGMQVSALGVILASIKGLAMPFKDIKSFWFFCMISVILIFTLAPYEPFLIIGLGLLAIWILNPFFLNHYQKANSFLKKLIANDRDKLRVFFVSLPLSSFLLGTHDSVPALIKTLQQLLWVCFKSGAFVFGTGVAIVPLLEKDFVENLQWLTQTEFLEALALGQITPGPVVITVAYIGFKVLGFFGALGATIAVFLPAFLHMVTWFPSAVNQLSRQTWIKRFLVGSNAAVVCSIVHAVLVLSLATHKNFFGVAVSAIVFLVSVTGWCAAWLSIPLGGLAYLFYTLVI